MEMTELFKCILSRTEKVNYTHCLHLTSLVVKLNKVIMSEDADLQTSAPKKMYS